MPEGASILLIHDIVQLEQKVYENISKNKLSVSTQTDIIPRRRKTLSPVKNNANKSVKKRTSTQTQTGEKRPKKTTETQTIFQFLSLKSTTGLEDKRKNFKNNFLISPTGRKRKKSMETQTLNSINIINFSKNNSNTSNSFQFSTSFKNDEESNSLGNSITKKDVCLPQLWINVENENINKQKINVDKEDSCSVYMTELNSRIINDINNDSINLQNNKTDDNSLLSFYNQHNFRKVTMIKESTNSSCHIETQTDNAQNNFIDDYLMNNCDNRITDDDMDQYTRCTQTCDDIILPNDIALDFTNNETQTAWSLCDVPFINDVVNSETQTPSFLI